jgi:hypothetical protein
MASSIVRVGVPTPGALESAALSYMARGYVIVERSAERVVLQKRKQFSLPWLVVGLLLCIVPLLVYLLVYASQPDAWVVELVVTPAS